MPDLFDEVDADLRSERMRAELLRYGKFVGVAAIVVAIGIGVWQLLLWHDRRNEAAVASAYYAAMAAAETPPATTAGAASGKAEAEADLARLTGKSTPIGYRTLARLNAAALAAKGGNLKLALTLWQDIVTDKSANFVYQDLARLLWVTHQIATVKPGSNVQPLLAELAPLLTPEDPWRPMAEEAKALIALAQDDKKAARSALMAILNDPSTPQGLHERASALLARLAR